MSIEWNNFFAERTKYITGSQIRQFFALTERPEVISFAGGFPGNDFFPNEDIAQTLAQLVREESQQSLQYGPTEGSFELRGLIAKKMAMEGADCEIDNLMIIDGSQQGLDFLGRILVNEEDPVLVEEPAYIGGMSAIKSYGGVACGVDMDDDGPLPEKMILKIEELIREGKQPKVFYTVPNFQNPTGVTTSLERRLEILKIASRYNLLIIEDNPYGPLCYEGEVPPSYFSLDADNNRVIYLGSFSKVLIPGIRIGWIAAAKALIEKASMVKQTADLCSSTLGQQLACCLSRDSYIDMHTRKLTELYRQKRDTMLESMERCFPSGIKFNKPRGGFFVWVTFPDHYPDSRELLQLALENNVAFVHGEGFFSNGGGKKSARFSFSQPSTEEIKKGIKTLGKIFYDIEGNSSLKAVGH